MPEFTRDQPRRKAVHNPVLAAKWGRSKPFCAACGAGEYGLHVLTNHHVIPGSGGRSDEPCNWLRLGMHVCHDLASGLDVRGEPRWVRCHECGPGILSCKSCMGFGWVHESGILLPKITLGIALSLKMRADPDEVDLERLQELRGSRLPDLEPIPQFFIDQWNKNQPNLNLGEL